MGEKGKRNFACFSGRNLGREGNVKKSRIVSHFSYAKGERRGGYFPEVMFRSRGK